MSSAKIKLPRRLPSEEPEIIEIIPAPAKKAKLPPLLDIDEDEEWDTGKKFPPVLDIDEEEARDVAEKFPAFLDIDEEEPRDVGKKKNVPRKKLSEEEKAARQAAKKLESLQKKKSREEEKAAKQAAKNLEKALKKSAQEARRNEAPGNAIKVCFLIKSF